MILVGVGEMRPSDVISLFLWWGWGVHHSDANGLRAWLQMAYARGCKWLMVCPFWKKMSPVMQLAYVCGCKRIMCVVANGLWLVFLVKMRPSDAIFGLCVLFANGLHVWLQMSYVCGFKSLLETFKSS